MDIIKLDKVSLQDVAVVGGKNASTGEMLQNLSQLGLRVPDGFATTTSAYQQFLQKNDLDKKITSLTASLNVDDVAALNAASETIRHWIMSAPFDAEFEKNILTAYRDMGSPTVAVRSSATAEDLEDASFAGQQETYLNVSGEDNLLNAIKMVFASLYTSRAISYRQHHQFDHVSIALSAGIQPMVRSDLGASGVMFTLDTESGFDKVVLITGSYGLGEAIVQGQVNPDEFYVYKPNIETEKPAILQRKLGSKLVKMVYADASHAKKSIKTVDVDEDDQIHFCVTDEDVLYLAKQALIIEKHYGKPMDIEWAKDGITGEIFILQARPETVKSRTQKGRVIERYTLNKAGSIITEGQSVGQQIRHGIARIIADIKQVDALKSGEVLVTDMTDPDWEPIMKQASAIVTNRGGRTCHAAIIARELGVPAVIGCGDATIKIKDGDKITVSCAEGQTGYVYKGHLPFEVKKVSVHDVPELPVNICINIGSPDKAFTNQAIPNDGVGLARLEFIISNTIGIHPNACLDFQFLPKDLQQKIHQKTAAYANPRDFYIDKLCEGISTIAAAFYPKQVIFRFSDFKSNEYAYLLGGELYEPSEENPMLGFRGASRYIDQRFHDCFTLECLAFKRVRDEMGLTNAQVMVPFVRKVDELKEVINHVERNGLKRGKNGLKIFMMCEIPANALLADEFLKFVDGFSIGSNDLTQLTLGLDRDSNLVAPLFDERNEAVKTLLHLTIQACLKAGKYVGICGQGPSDYPDFAAWLIREGIQSISLNPDVAVDTRLLLAENLEKLKMVI